MCIRLCGQKFSALDKIAWLREMRPDLDIAVDGGIDNLTAQSCTSWSQYISIGLYI